MQQTRGKTKTNDGNERMCLAFIITFEEKYRTGCNANLGGAVPHYPRCSTNHLEVLPDPNHKYTVRYIHTYVSIYAYIRQEKLESPSPSPGVMLAHPRTLHYASIQVLSRCNKPIR